jgi:hypothetical protein
VAPDFRSAQWREHEVRFEDGKIIGEIAPPENGHLVFFGEIDYDIDGLRYHLSTQMRMTK